MNVMPYRTCISLVIFTFDLVIGYTEKSVSIPMGIICAPLVADLFVFLFCYEKDYMTFLSYQVDIIEAFKSTSRY